MHKITVTIQRVISWQGNILSWLLILKQVIENQGHLWRDYFIRKEGLNAYASCVQQTEATGWIRLFREVNFF
jgi:hypothetical protein